MCSFLQFMYLSAFGRLHASRDSRTIVVIGEERGGSRRLGCCSVLRAYCALWSGMRLPGFRLGEIGGGRGSLGHGDFIIHR